MKNSSVEFGANTGTPLVEFIATLRRPAQTAPELYHTTHDVLVELLEEIAGAHADLLGIVMARSQLLAVDTLYSSGLQAWADEILMGNAAPKLEVKPVWHSAGAAYEKALARAYGSEEELTQNQLTELFGALSGTAIGIASQLPVFHKSGEVGQIRPLYDASLRVPIQLVV